MTRACPTCRWSEGIDCERPDSVPTAWLERNEVDGVLVRDARDCPGWSGGATRRERCVDTVLAEPGLTTAEIAARVGAATHCLVASLRTWGLVSVLSFGVRPGVVGTGSKGRIRRWYSPEDAPASVTQRASGGDR